LFKDKFLKWGYEFFITQQQKGRNDVVIAISKEFKPHLHSEVKIRNLNSPDFLSVSAEYPNSFFIVGVRFLGNYNDMKNQFSNFIPLINSLENVVIGGDFNNAKLHGDRNKVYTMQEVDDKYKGLLQYSYNYHRIALWFKETGFELVTPLRGCSYPQSGNPIDHFAVNGIGILRSEYKPTNLSDHNQLIGEITI